MTQPAFPGTRRALLAASAAALALGSFATLPAHAQQVITLHGASQFNDDHAFTKTMVRFEELVKKYYGKPGTRSARLVLDDHGLAKALPEFCGHDPRIGVRGPAWRRRNDEVHRFLRVFSAGDLGGSERADHQGRSQAENADLQDGLHQKLLMPGS